MPPAASQQAALAVGRAAVACDLHARHAVSLVMVVVHQLRAFLDVAARESSWAVEANVRGEGEMEWQGMCCACRLLGNCGGACRHANHRQPPRLN